MADLKPIDRNDPLIYYRESVRFGLESGSAPGMRGQRDVLAALTLNLAQTQQLQNLDEEVVDLIAELDYVDTDLQSDDDQQPFDRWWWHLGKLRAGTYPTERLPEYLRVIYDPAGIRDTLPIRKRPARTIDHNARF